MPADPRLAERRVQLGDELKAIEDIQRSAPEQRFGRPIASVVKSASGWTGCSRGPRQQRTNVTFLYQAFSWLSIPFYDNLLSRHLDNFGQDVDAIVYEIALTASLGDADTKRRKCA